MRIRPRCPLFGGASPLQQVFSAAGLTLVGGRDRAGGEGSPLRAPPLPGPALAAWPSRSGARASAVAAGLGVRSAAPGDMVASVSVFPAFCALV